MSEHDYKYIVCELADGSFAKIPKGLIGKPAKALDPSLDSITNGGLTEKQVQEKLHKKLKGRKEVVTEAGRIDLLTSDEVIEIKKANLWVHGIGQLMIYSGYYPSHKPRLHLFGTFHDTHLAVVIKHCSRLGIRVTWEE